MPITQVPELAHLGKIPEMASPLRVAYVVGTGHCGSTLLALLANTHPEVVSVGEVAPSRAVQRRINVNLRCSCRVPIEECSFWNAVFDRVRQRGIRFSSKLWPTEHRYQNEILHRTLTASSDSYGIMLCRRVIADLIPLHRRRMRQVDAANVAWIASLLEVTGKSVFLDASKRLMRLQRLAGIPQIDLRVVWLTRDVRAFVYSAQTKEAKQWSPKQSAQHWLQFHRGARRLLKQIPSERIVQLRYEDVCRDLETSGRRFFHHLQVRPTPFPAVVPLEGHHVFGNGMRLRGPHRVQINESWRERLSREDCQIAIRIAGDLNRELGYID